MVYGGFLAFTIANSLALLVETGAFQIPDPVLFYNKRGHQWEPTYESVNFTAVYLHGIASFTMFSYPPEKKTKYDFIEKPIFTFFLLFLLLVWDVHSLVSDSSRFTTALLETETGIFWAHLFFRILVLGQFFTTCFLVFYFMVTSRPLIRLPEDFDSRFLLLFLYFPLFPCYFFQYSHQDGDMFFVFYSTLFYGLAYLKVYLDQR